MTCESNLNRSQVYKDLFIRRCRTIPQRSSDRITEALEIYKSAETTRSLGIMTQGELEEVEEKLAEICPQIVEKVHIAP